MFQIPIHSLYDAGLKVFVGLPAEFLAKLPILDLGAQRARNLVERRVGGPLGDNMVAGLDHSHDGVEVSARAAIGLQNVIGIDLPTIQLGNLGLNSGEPSILP